LQAEDYAAIEQIAALDPEKAEELGSAWMRHMRAGDFTRAWEVSDEVLRRRAGHTCDHLPRHFQWVWNGESLAGKRILIRCYHGLGDTIQFIRYARLVRQIARRVIVWAQPELMPAAAHGHGIDELLPLRAGAAWRGVRHATSSRWSWRMFSAPQPTRCLTTCRIFTSGRRICRAMQISTSGLVWKCGYWAPERSIPIDLLLPLAEIPGVTLHVLQRGSGLASGRRVWCGVRI
jgi:hypothetical protein